MLKLRQLTITPILRNPFLHRQYVQKPTKLKNQPKMATKQVHKEVMKYVNQYAKIQIKSDIYLKVYAADVHRYPNADVLVAELHGLNTKNSTIDLNVNVVEEKEGRVEVIVSKSRGQNGSEKDFHCELAVPVKAALTIDGKDGVSVEHMLGDEVTVFAEGNIKTRDVRCDKIALKSGSGHINCAGTLLGKSTVLETRQKGCILLDKLQGDELTCTTEAGDIHTNCCYVGSSKFETDSGCLELNNVHMNTKVHVNKPDGALHMSGVHANLQVKSNGSVMKLQLSELFGESFILSDNIETATINISNEIEHGAVLNIQAQSISLNQTLQYLETNLTEHKKCFTLNSSEEKTHNSENRSKLMVRCTKGNIILGKQSWAEIMCGNFRQNNNIQLT